MSQCSLALYISPDRRYEAVLRRPDGPRRVASFFLPVAHRGENVRRSFLTENGGQLEFINTSKVAAAYASAVGLFPGEVCEDAFTPAAIDSMRETVARLVSHFGLGAC